MKKLITIISLFVIVISSVAAEMTWADYELLCEKYGVEAKYEDYQNLPRDTEFGYDEESEILKLFNNN